MLCMSEQVVHILYDYLQGVRSLQASDPRATGERLVTLLVTNFKEELKKKIGNEGCGPQDFIEGI